MDLTPTKPTSSRREVFVVRLWRENGEGEPWRGQVQHVRTGRETGVRDLPELLAYFSSLLEGEPGEEDRLVEPLSGLK